MLDQFQEDPNQECTANGKWAVLLASLPTDFWLYTWISDILMCCSSGGPATTQMIRVP